MLVRVFWHPSRSRYNIMQLFFLRSICPGLSIGTNNWSPRHSWTQSLPCAAKSIISFHSAQKESDWSLCDSAGALWCRRLWTWAQGEVSGKICCIICMHCKWYEKMCCCFASRTWRRCSFWQTDVAHIHVFEPQRRDRACQRVLLVEVRTVWEKAGFDLSYLGWSALSSDWQWNDGIRVRMIRNFETLSMLQVCSFFSYH